RRRRCDLRHGLCALPRRAAALSAHTRTGSGSGRCGRVNGGAAVNIMADIPMRRAVVLGGVRIPFCRSHTAYAELSNLDMLTASLGGLLDRFLLHGAPIHAEVGGPVA